MFGDLEGLNDDEFAEMMPERKSGFENIEDVTYIYQKPLRPCMSPHHNPPSHLHVPSGQRYRHFCPSCGAMFVIEGDTFYL